MGIELREFVLISIMHNLITRNASISDKQIIPWLAARSRLIYMKAPPLSYFPSFIAIGPNWIGLMIGRFRLKVLKYFN